MSSLSTLSMPDSYQALFDQYYNQRCQDVCEISANKEKVYIGRFFDYFRPPDMPSELFAALRPKSITDFVIDYDIGHGHGSKRLMINALRSFLRFAYRAGYLKSDLSILAPNIHVRRMGKIVRSIPQECINTLLTSIDCSTLLGIRDKAIICLLATYGVRGVQVRHLCLEDINWADRLIHFRAAKGGRPIDQFLTTQAGNSLAEYVTKARPESSHREMFLTADNPCEPLKKSEQLSRITRKRFLQAGITLPEGVSYGSHGFRHAFATALYGKVPFKDIVDMLGHRDPSSTLIYGKVDIATLRKAALPWPGGKS